MQLFCVVIALFFFLFIPIEGYSYDIDSELIQAVKDENIAMVIALLEKGANVNAKGDFESKPLIIIDSKLRNIECVRILLANGGTSILSAFGNAPL